MTLEVANVIVVGVRKRAIPMTLDETGHRAERWVRLFETEPALLAALAAKVLLADRYGLTTYDAAYLELALRRRLPLATPGRQLQDAARAAGVTCTLV